MKVTTYTLKNIEDWDFRQYKAPLFRMATGLPQSFADEDQFMEANLFYVIAVEHLRLSILWNLVKSGHAELSPDKEYVVMNAGMESMLRYMTSFRDRFTSEGRFHRLIMKALVREQERDSRMKFTLLPSNMEEQFPGLSETPERSEHRPS